MLDFNQVIEQAQKLGFDFFTDELIDYFDFPNECVSLPFISYIHSQSGLKLLTTRTRDDLSKGNENLQRTYKNAKKGSQLSSTKASKPLSAYDVKMIKKIMRYGLVQIEAAHNVYFSMYVITLVSKFEAYIQDMIAEISKYYPDTMKSGKTVTLNEILQFNKMSALIEYLAENVSSKGTEGKATEYICRLSDKFGISICQFKELISEVEYFVDLRHIQVHRNGIIDSQFHIKYPHAGNLGERIILNFDVVAQMSHVFRFTVNLLEVMLTMKYPKVAIINDLDNLFMQIEGICVGEKSSFTE